MIFERDPHRLFGVPRAHALALVDRTERTGADRVREVRWFVETDARGEVLARYRCWDERARGDAPRQGARAHSGTVRARPARSLGWERYAPDGTLTAREVRHAPRADDAVAMH